MFFWGARPVCEDCLEMVLFLILVGDKKGTLEFFMWIHGSQPLGSKAGDENKSSDGFSGTLAAWYSWESKGATPQWDTPKK